MIISSLAALCLGFVLDLMLGDLKFILYPQNLIAALVKKLEKAIRKKYVNTAEAQHMAGLMTCTLVIIIVAVVSVAAVIGLYRISSLAGMIMEAVLCWSSISLKRLRTSAGSVRRSTRSGNLVGAQRRVKEITCRDTDELDMDGAIKCAVESVSENTVDWVYAPIFWAMLFGGIGAILCRTVNIMDNIVGYKTDKYKYFGSAAAKLDDVVMYIPARIAALLMRLDVSFLGLDSKNCKAVYKRDRKKSPSPNSAQTQSVCAGALDITLGSDEYYSGQLVRKQIIGNNIKSAEPNDIYWANNLMNGTAAFGMLLAAIVRVAFYFLLK